MSNLGTSFVCKTPFEELKPITLNEMKVPMVHRGRYLLCRSIVQPLASMNTDTLIQDLNGIFNNTDKLPFVFIYL